MNTRKTRGCEGKQRMRIIGALIGILFGLLIIALLDGWWIFKAFAVLMGLTPCARC